jgi:hypothetical protein
MAGIGGIVKMGEKELATLASKNPEYFAKIEKALAKQGGGLSKAFGITGLGLGAGAAGAALASNSPVAEQTNTVGGGLITPAGSSDTSGSGGSGSLPARRSRVSPRISATMSTDKLLHTAIGYLASIDSNVKEQNDLTRFKFTSDENAKRESAFEGKKGLSGGAMSPMTAMSRQAEKIGDGLLGALAKLGLVAAAMSASKVVKWVFENPGKALSIAGTAGLALMGAKPALAAAKTVGTIAAAKAAPMLGKMAVSAGELVLKIPGLSSIAKLAGGASKTGILNLAKKIPFIGALIGLGLAYMRFKEGDLLGASLQVVSGFLPMFGPLGIAAAFALDAGLVVRDIKKEVAPSLADDTRGNAPRPNARITPGSKTAATSGSLHKSNGAKNYVPPKDVYSYIRSKGLSDDQALGMMANIQAESGFDSAIINPDDKGAPAGGLFQHRADRLTKLKAYAGDDWQTNWKKQIDFALSESEGQAYASTKFASAADASESFTRKFERPDLTGGTVEKRINNLTGIKKELAASNATMLLDQVARTPTKNEILTALAPPMAPRNGVSPTGRSAQAPVNMQVNNVSAPQQQSNSGRVPNPNHSGNDWMKYNSSHANYGD